MKKIHFVYISLLLVLLTSCGPRYLDLSGQQNLTAINQPEEKYEFLSIVWLSENTIIFTADTSDRKTPNPFLIYDIQSQSWDKIIVPPSQICDASGFGFLARLPNGNIGFINTCIRNGNETRTLDEIDISSRKIKTLMGSGIIHVAGAFSFSPDMSELVQEDMIGRFLSNQLFYRKGETSTQIVPNFIRAMYPDWSPHDDQIAFWGTDNSYDKSTAALALSAYPFDLYISTPKGENLKKILSSIENPGGIEWSPRENTIAFAGEYANQQGIWLVDAATSQVTRIWPRSSGFDWSPDGSKMVILDEQRDQKWKIIDQSIKIISIY